jgi:hypothetical protein
MQEVQCGEEASSRARERAKFWLSGKRELGACGSIESGERDGMTGAAQLPARVMIPDAAGGRRRAEGISSREKFYRLADWVVAISGGKLWTEDLRIKKVQTCGKSSKGTAGGEGGRGGAKMGILSVNGNRAKGGRFGQH